MAAPREAGALEHGQARAIALPDAIYERVRRFVVDRRTGNVILNIRDGQILKAVLEEHVTG